MSKLLEIFRSAPPAPPVVLLPDDRFFIKVVPVPATATAEEAAAQAALVLETISPFPPAQLYYGHYWVPGSERLLVYASYRKRFSPEQRELWSGSKAVLPTFATVLRMEHDPATTVLIPNAEGLTAVHWDDGAVPTTILTRRILPEATEEERAKIREEILRASGESRKVVDLTSAPEVVLTDDDKTFGFRAGEIWLELPAAMTGAMDVRDKEELVVLRRSEGRDLLLWRAFMGSLAALLILGLAEGAIIAGRKMWFASMTAQVKANTPAVDSIIKANELAGNIEDMISKKVLPLEMVTMIGKEETRGNVQFTRFTIAGTANVYEMTVVGRANAAADVDVYTNRLRALPGISNVTVVDNRFTGGQQTFTLNVAFKPEVLKPATDS